MSAAMYVLMTEEDFKKAASDKEEIKYLGPDEIDLADSRDFCYYASYVSSTDYHETLDERIEAANNVVRYLNRNGVIALVDKKGVISLSPNAGIRYAKFQLMQLKSALENMTPAEYADTGEYKLRMAIRNEDIFAHPFNYADNSMPVGEYPQTMDAFIHNLYYSNADKNEKEYHFVVTQTVWMHS